MAVFLFRSHKQALAWPREIHFGARTVYTRIMTSRQYQQMCLTIYLFTPPPPPILDPTKKQLFLVLLL